MGNVCHMLIGHPCSGKTTFRNQILEIMIGWSIEVLSLDDRLELLTRIYGISYNEAFKLYSKSCGSIVNNSAKNAYQNKKDVIWDMTNLTAKSRANKLRLFPDYGKIAYVFPILTIEEIMKRQTNSNRIGKTIPEKVIEGMLMSYQPPTFSEGFKEIVLI